MICFTNTQLVALCSFYAGYKVKKVIVADIQLKGLSICLTESYKCNAYGRFHARDGLSVFKIRQN